MRCYQCPRQCGADREKQRGFCGMGDRFTVARAAPHFWEEPCISGKNGSGAVFFSGCSLRCVYCQNKEISTDGFGREISDCELMRLFDSLVSKGVHNINLVNPTHYALRLRDVLREYKSPVPIVYNCGGYEDAEALKQLEGLVDIWLPDFKYVDSAVSEKYSKAADYFSRASSALTEMLRQCPVNSFDEEGILKRGVIVRHLILPKNTKNSIKVLQWLHENCPGVTLSLMAQYTPHGELQDFPELTRPITEREYLKVAQVMEDLGFKNGYIQELESAREDFIPNFDLSGLEII